jgi:hypothetical protein
MELKDPDALRARLAILKIFEDAGVPAGEVRSVREIAQAWPRYGVRSSDLAPALESLLDEGALTLAPGSEDALRLTTEGDRWLRRHPGWLKYRLLAPRFSRMRLDVHAEQPDPPVFRRRSADSASRVQSG